MTESIVTEWRERIAAAAAARTPLAIRGGGTKDFYGNAVAAPVLDTRGYAGIIDYDPTELVMTARCGTTLDDIDAALRDAGQMLACEPPRFDARTPSASTLGGCAATGLSGPRRMQAGAMRDLVLGVRVLDGRGEDLSFGGRVMKNVAGFDVARLMTGAMGTLGVLLEVSFKCVPVPRVETTRVFQCKVGDAIQRVNEWSARPLPVSATCYHDGLLSVRLSGAPAAVTAATARIGGDALLDPDGGAAFWVSVRDHTHRHFAQAQAAGRPLWRLSVGSTAAFADLGGEQLIEWGGALRWLAADERAEPAKLRSWAIEQGGHATLFRGGDRSSGVFQALPDALAAVHRGVKDVYDPAGILNPGRMYPGL